MMKRLPWLVVTILLGIAPVAHAQDPVGALQQVGSAAQYFLANVSYDDAAFCDDQQAKESRGAAVDWTEDQKLRCSAIVGDAAAMITLVSGGTIPIADAVTMYCFATDALDGLEEFNRWMNEPFPMMSDTPTEWIQLHARANLESYAHINTNDWTFAQLVVGTVSNGFIIAGHW